MLTMSVHCYGGVDDCRVVGTRGMVCISSHGCTKTWLASLAVSIHCMKFTKREQRSLSCVPTGSGVESCSWPYSVPLVCNNIQWNL
jgi:hypothetical protein